MVNILLRIKSSPGNSKEYLIVEWLVTCTVKAEFHNDICFGIYRVIQRDGLNWGVICASTHARQLVAVFQVLCSLYRLTCVGYAQNSLEFVSRSPLIHAKNLGLHNSHFALNWRCCGGIWKLRTSSFKCYVDHSITTYSSGNTDIPNWVHLFKSPCIYIIYICVCV